MSKTKNKKEDFGEDCPRFIPMELKATNGFYIFDTEKLDFLPFSSYYYNPSDCEKACDIVNAVDYLFKELQGNV